MRNPQLKIVKKGMRSQSVGTRSLSWDFPFSCSHCPRSSDDEDALRLCQVCNPSLATLPPNPLQLLWTHVFHYAFNTMASR